MKSIPVKYINGSIEYFDINGEHHRGGDKPSIIRANGNRLWYKHGKLHREGDKPAIITLDNREKVWYQNGMLHRDGDKPAVIYRDGGKSWYQNGVSYEDKINWRHE